MKAFVKININIHFDEVGSNLAVHRAGVVEVADAAEGERVIAALESHVNSTFVQMGVKCVPPPSGEAWKPDLALAHGGVAPVEMDRSICPGCEHPVASHTEVGNRRVCQVELNYSGRECGCDYSDKEYQP